MAVDKFIQSVWSKQIMDDLELKCKLVDNCLRDYEGDCKYAQSVHILGVGDPTISAYNGNTEITIEEMSDTEQILYIDQANYFAFYVDDVNKAQSVPGLAEKYRAKAVHGLAVKRDSKVAEVIAAVANKTTIENTTEAGVKAAIDKAIVALRERNFDEDGVIEITPATYNLFKNYLITTSTNNPELIRKGVVGMYDTFEVIMSNNLATPGCVRGKKAVAFAGQINEVEALRAERRFKDIIRGLDTFGVKVIDDKRIQVLVAKG